MLSPWISYGQSVFPCTPVLRRFIMTGFCFGFHSPNTLQRVNILSWSSAVSREYCHANMLSTVKPTLQGNVLYQSACKKSQHPHLHMQTVITEQGAWRKELRFFWTIKQWLVDTTTSNFLCNMSCCISERSIHRFTDSSGVKKETTLGSAAATASSLHLQKTAESFLPSHRALRDPSPLLPLSLGFIWIIFSIPPNPFQCQQRLLILRSPLLWIPLSHFGQITASFEGLP